MNKLPKARSKNILVQNLENEVLIYDAMIDKAYCLNETSANIFNHCNGETSFDELKSRYEYTDDLIYLALDGLKSKNLLTDDNSYQSPLAEMTRREAVRRVGLGTIVALPFISGLVAPSGANAASRSCPPLSPVAACTPRPPNTNGCFGSGVNTAVCGGGTTGRSCATACAPFGPSCCSCQVQFAIDRGTDCYCACG